MNAEMTAREIHDELQHLKAEMEKHLTQLKLATNEALVLRRQLEFYKAFYDTVKSRCPYPVFCHQPAVCCGKGNCQAEYCCAD